MGRSKIPGDGGYVILSSKGMIELLKSVDVQDELTSRMQRVKSALPGSIMEVDKTRTRLRIKVIRGSDFDEANTGELSSALDLAGGLRGKNNKGTRKAKRKARKAKT